MPSRPRVLLLSALFVGACALVVSAVSWGQASHPDQVKINPPLLSTVDPPSPDATVADLEARGDQLNEQKLYLDARDYYRAALAKEPNAARLFNKIGITELQMRRYGDAKRSFERAIKADRSVANAYNNLGVVYYEERKYGAAIKQYRKAIALDNTSASFFSNMGAAQFARKEFEAAVISYQHALDLDPDVFERVSRTGVQAQLPSPEDRARYDYTVAKLYAKMGRPDRSLQYLRKAMEEGYKDFNNVYKDTEFAELRKDKRFAELVASKPPALPN
jgi:cytochrome c-type biogenesis protein CcmH/NrfG